MVEFYRKLLDLLTPRERRRFYLLLVLILIQGLVEMVGVAAILPFMAVLANPEVVQSNAWLAWVYETLGFTDTRGFLVLLGAGVFAVVVLGLLFRTVTQYAIYRFASLRGHTVSSQLLQGYLRQPYAWFLNRHSADLGTNALVEVYQLVHGAMVPAMKLLSYATIVICMVALLVVAQPVAALVAATVIGGGYAAIYLSVRNYLLRSGEERHEMNEERFQIAGEAIGGIKDVKLLGLEDAYMRRFRRPSLRLATVTATSTIIAEIPRNILEALSFGGMLAFILYLLAAGDGTLGGILPVLGLYAFAGLRMFPALQQLYGSVTAMRFSEATLERLHRDVLENRRAAPPPPAPDRPALRLRQRLELSDVHFAYPNAERAALRGADVAIEANTRVGIVGGTGAGKTTLVDVMLGLLTPQQGEIRVDGVTVTPDTLRAWQKTIGYVPQQIFLTDDTVAANIAFGIEPEAIDRAALERASRIAELHDFVTGELPLGYETLVGERGVRLSGGQRQRIGIARALYHDPDVLILDEATSALDNLTERAVMDAVRNLGHAKTVVMIAHRLTTVRDCDVIFMMEQGRVIAAGRYDDLLDTSQKFRAMAGGQA